MDDEDDVDVCDWCGTDDVAYTDCSVWACHQCVWEYNLNTNRPEVNGFSKWAR